MDRRDMLPRRVDESSRTPKPKPQHLSSSPVSSNTSPSSARRSGKKAHAKKEAVETVEDAVYPARAILKQQTRKGKVWYLVDWEDNKVTGEKYEPTWEPHNFVSLDLTAEWQKTQLEETRTEKRAAAEVLGSPDNSQPIRPAKRRKLVRRKDIAGEKEAGSATTEPEPDNEGSQAETEVQRLERVIPDSYEEEGEHSVLRGAADTTDQARVEIGVPQDFDASAYVVYNNISSSPEASRGDSQSINPDFSSDPFKSSQPSQILVSTATLESSGPVQSSSASQTQFRQLSQSPEDEHITIDIGSEEIQSRTSETLEAGANSSDPIESSAPVTPRASKHPFIWDEDAEDEDIEPLEVPDSQEPRESSSYKPSETPPSKTTTSTDSTTRQNTQTNTEASLEAIEFRNSQHFSLSSTSVQQDSGSIESQFAQRASFLDQESYTDTPAPTSAQTPTTQSLSQSIGNSNDSQPLEDSSARQIDTERSGSPAAVNISSSPVVQSQDYLSSAHLGSGQSDDISNKEYSVGFQTQLPRVSCEVESGDLPPSGDESDERDHDFEVQSNLDHLQREEPGLVDEEDSVVDARTQGLSEPRSLSNFTEWQPSRIISQSQVPSDRPHSGGRGTQDDPIQIVSPQEETFPNSEIPTSQVGNTQRSNSSKSSAYSQASSHLPSPPIDDIRPTIEEVEPLDIKHSIEQFSSSPIQTPRRAYQSSSMEPPNDTAVAPPSTPMHPTDIMKAKLAASRAARASASMVSQSPAPALTLTNQHAVSSNQALPIPTPIEPSHSEPPVIPAFETPAPVFPAPAIEPSVAPLMSAAPVEESAPSPHGINPETIAHFVEEDDEEPTSMRVVPPGPEIYEVALPMTGYTRDIYVRRVKIYKVQLQSFLRDEVLDETLVAEVSSLLETLHAICSHPGLLDEDSTQSEDHEIQAKWAENVSTKFIFLAEFLELMQATDNHVVIMAEPGQILDELESLLIYHSIEYSRADRQRRTSTGKFRVTIYPAGTQQYNVDPPSFIIAVDPSYRTFPYLKDVRTHPSFPGQLAPLISLVIANSVEHIERCFDNNLEAVGRLIRVTSCIQQLMERVGTFEDEGYFDPPVAASLIADYLIGGPRERSWPLLPMPTIDGLDLNMSSQTSSAEQHSYNLASSKEAWHSGKRQLESEGTPSTEFSKRQRIISSDGNTDSSHISETVQRTLSTSGGFVNSAEDERARISSLLQKVGDLEAQLHAKEATEKQLREINADLETRCSDYESSIASIQPKYQEALNDRGEFEHEYRLALDRELRMKKERDNKDAEVIKLRDKTATLEAELSAAQKALATSDIPEAAEFAKLREELAASRLETDREHKRYLSANSDLEYLRSSFQTSSSSAAEHNNELRTLQTELTSLREKSTLDKVRIHEIQTSNENTELRQENTDLKARLKDMERDFEKKQEELKAATNGRRTMRGASVPQSPRMGNQNQNSPGTRAPIGRVLHGGSRGNSPAPGDVRGAPGPFPGAAFGDALFLNPPSQRERWGNHLQQ